ncbi:MAG: type II toxin-antitoxin system Phd/YefM family antitoxin [bacterium]|nr:type II toxin-antitoxin system Phd/YefM family antitoxin [bacterium]
MNTVTFTEFRRNAAACFDAVEKGQKIRILRHGKPVADLVPVPDAEQPLSWKNPALRLAIQGASLSQKILEEREQPET